MKVTKVFLKILCPRSRSPRGQGHQKMWLLKGVVPRNVVSKHEVNMFTNKEVTTNVRVFRKFYVQGQGHPGVKVTKGCCCWKVLSQGILCPNMMSICLLIRKLWPMLKFFQNSMSKVKVIKGSRSPNDVPTERSCPKECYVQIWSEYLY